MQRPIYKSGCKFGVLVCLFVRSGSAVVRK
jgi:hypothetical protein